LREAPFYVRADTSVCVSQIVFYKRFPSDALQHVDVSLRSRTHVLCVFSPASLFLTPSAPLPLESRASLLILSRSCFFSSGSDRRPVFGSRFFLDFFTPRRRVPVDDDLSQFWELGSRVSSGDEVPFFSPSPVRSYPLGATVQEFRPT